MAAIANITVYDGAGTPASHTLNAQSVVSQPDGTVEARWQEALSGTPAYANVRASVQMKPLKSGVMRVQAEVIVPVMESVSGQNAQGYTAAPKVAYENRLTCVGFFHQRSTVTDRRLAKQILANLLNNVSSSVAAATSGPLPDAFDSLVAPT
jgi:hypothetical protein